MVYDQYFINIIQLLAFIFIRSFANNDIVRLNARGDFTIQDAINLESNLYAYNPVHTITWPLLEPTTAEWLSPLVTNLRNIAPQSSYVELENIVDSNKDKLVETLPPVPLLANLQWDDFELNEVYSSNNSNNDNVEGVNPLKLVQTNKNEKNIRPAEVTEQNKVNKSVLADRMKGIFRRTGLNSLSNTMGGKTRSRKKTKRRKTAKRRSRKKRTKRRHKTK